MRNCSQLDTSIFEKLSASGTLKDTLEELDLSQNQNLDFQYEKLKLDLLPFNSLQQIMIQGCNIKWDFWINLKFFNKFNRLKITY